jgi:hypothetical protein
LLPFSFISLFDGTQYIMKHDNSAADKRKMRVILSATNREKTSHLVSVARKRGGRKYVAKNRNRFFFFFFISFSNTPPVASLK